MSFNNTFSIDWTSPADKDDFSFKDPYVNFLNWQVKYSFSESKQTIQFHPYSEGQWTVNGNLRVQIFKNDEKIAVLYNQGV
jgi:hypothetical protein